MNIRKINKFIFKIQKGAAEDQRIITSHFSRASTGCKKAVVHHFLMGRKIFGTSFVQPNDHLKVRLQQLTSGHDSNQNKIYLLK